MNREFGDFWLSPHFFIEAMSVISSATTTEGFVIGSDGRICGFNRNEVITDDAQKIFPVEKPECKLAYGLFGSGLIGQDLEHVIFDFKKEVAQIVHSVDTALDWWQYMTAISTNLAQNLNGARCGHLLDAALMERGTFIVIGGFYQRAQKLGHIEVKHSHERSMVEPHNYPSGFSFPFGSIKVFELLNNRDPRFSKYSSPPRVGLSTLAEGIERVKNDILAHYDPKASEVDQETCRGVGGRVQIATVTATEGFRWVPGFEASQK